MAVIVRFPLMEVVDEDDYTGNKSTVIKADDKLQYLVNRFFELKRDIDFWKDCPLVKIIPRGIRDKKVNKYQNELKEVFSKMQNKVYNETGA